MKTIITTLWLIILITSGCQKPKEHTCVCKITEVGLFTNVKSTRTETHVIHDKKRKAVKKCDNYEPDGIQAFSTTDCAIQ